MNNTIKATIVSPKNRKNFLPKHFGKFFFMAENSIYHSLETMSSNYRGAFWNFFELSNAGFYMAPDLDYLLEISVQGNGFQDKLSADAAGIVSTLCIINALCWKTESDDLATKYHLLLDFSEQHPEAAKIFAAID